MKDNLETSSQPKIQISEGKQTILGLYLTSKEAYEMWRNEQNKVHIIDVRTPEEYVFVGHVEMAKNIPLIFVKHEWNAKMNMFNLKPNSEFISQAKDLFKPNDTLLVMCRSGDRSAKAVNALTQAGFLNVYNIIDGMEGDMVEDNENMYNGKRMKNGWKNSGLPWTYETNQDKILL